MMGETNLKKLNQCDRTYMKFTFYRRYPYSRIRTSLTYQEHLIHLLCKNTLFSMSIVPKEKNKIVYQNKVLLLLWHYGEIYHFIYPIAFCNRETLNYSAFYCQLNISQVTSFRELNLKAVNKVSSVFQMQTLILA